METKQKMTPAQVREFYKQNNVSEKRLAALQVEINRIPENGIFALPTVGKIVTDAGETIYPAIQVVNSKGDLVGSIAVGSIYAGEAVPVKYDVNANEKSINSVIAVETQEIRNPKSAYKGKFMVKSIQLNNLAKFGASQEMVVANLFGKAFKTTPKKTLVARVTADGSQFKATPAEAGTQFDIKTIYQFDIED